VGGPAPETAAAGSPVLCQRAGRLPGSLPAGWTPGCLEPWCTRWRRRWGRAARRQLDLAATGCRVDGGRPTPGAEMAAESGREGEQTLASASGERNEREGEERRRRG
jgi:hypothetical protein